MDGIAREGECTGKIMSQRDKPRLALNNITAGVREREEANRTREAGHLDEIQGVVANTLNAFRGRAVGFIDWLDDDSTIRGYVGLRMETISDARASKLAMMIPTHTGMAS